MIEAPGYCGKVLDYESEDLISSSTCIKLFV